MEELESAWEYLNEYISMNYSDCSSLPELCDGFGVRKDGQKKEIWEVVRDGLLQYDKEMRIDS
jgi:hypothetical protein